MDKLLLVNMKLYFAFLCFWDFQVVLSAWVTLKAAYEDHFLGFLLSSEFLVAVAMNSAPQEVVG